MKKLTTEPYKGTRDFYPEDMRLQKYIFGVMRSVAERYGYQEYTASIIEETDLYRAKSGEELVGEQTYSFTDRGGRDITLRPEMTPTVARMVANRQRELTYPVRWYSIPNCFRYERPQRGRLREFWQLNVDLLGDKGIYADAEIMQMAHDVMIAFGATANDFSIRVNDRKLMSTLFHEVLALNESSAYTLAKLIDRKHKISADTFIEEATTLVGDKIAILQEFLQATSIDTLPKILQQQNITADLIMVMQGMDARGIQNYSFDPTLMRGLDYYTGVVFEVYDTDPANTRSLFGGGRYDGLVDLFGVPSVPAVGFGMGDVTIQDFLETHGLVPDLTSTRTVTLCVLDSASGDGATALAIQLRNAGITVAVDYTDKKIGAKIKSAEAQGSEYVICIGEEEVTTGTYTLKNITTFSEEKGLNVQDIIQRLSL